TESRLIDINFSIAHHSLSRQRTRVPAGTAALSREWQSLGIGARWSGAPATKERAMTLITPFSKIVVNGTTGDDTFNFSVNQFGAPNLSPFGVEYHSNGGNDNIIGTWHDDTFVLNSGHETINGNGGNDTVDYSGSPTGVNVHLDRVDQWGGWAQGDQLFNI